MEWVADFETNTTEETVRANPVWAWGAAELGGANYEYGTSIDTFMKLCIERGGRCWFHNLAFDGRFIISWLYANNYEWTNVRKPAPNEFGTLIDAAGKFYSITVNFGTKAIVFADSLKKMPFSLAVVAQTYGLEMTKGEIDYTLYREKGHELTEEERDYLKRDVLILAQALKQRFALGDKLTTGADCLAVYKDLVGRKWHDYFPNLSEFDCHLRAAYRGGFVYVNPIHQHTTDRPCIVEKGITLDVNSLYPYIMRTRVLPYGKPVIRHGKPGQNKRMPLWISTVTCTFYLKTGKIPCIQIKGNPMFNGREYQTLVLSPVELTLTNVDWELMNECYEVDVWQWGETFYFKGSTTLFKDYVDQGIQQKYEAKNIGERTTAKLWLNNLYGKLAQKTSVTGKRPSLAIDGGVAYVFDEPTERQPVYLPGGIFITSWARDYTIRTAMEFGDRFCYADTDSIHAIGEEIPLDVAIDDKRLGAWKIEGRWSRAKFLRAKTYCETVNGIDQYTCAGMTDGIKRLMTFEEFTQGFTTDPKRGYVPTKYMQSGVNKLVPRDVPGGVILEERPFTIN